MRDLSSQLSFAVGLVTVALLASFAAGGEVLKLENGDLVAGDVVSLDDTRVVFEREAGGRLTVPWSRVLPISRYELWESTLEADDAAGRVELARWALSADLYSAARRELIRADGLGVEDADAVQSLVAEVNRREADAALAAVDALVEKGDPQAALERVRRYIRIAPTGKDADRVRARVPDLLVRIEQKDARAADEVEDAKAKKQRERRERWLAGQIASAAKTKGKATEDSIEAFAYLAKGNQTRARRALTKSEKGFTTTRTVYKKVKRVVVTGEIAQLCKREMADCDRRLLDVLTRWGRMEVDNKSWKRASAVVDRGLRIDSVHRELLDLRRVIDENWIRRKLSGITNASGRESGN